MARQALAFGDLCAGSCSDVSSVLAASTQRLSGCPMGMGGFTAAPWCRRDLPSAFGFALAGPAIVGGLSASAPARIDSRALMSCYARGLRARPPAQRRGRERWHLRPGAHIAGPNAARKAQQTSGRLVERPGVRIFSVGLVPSCSEAVWAACGSSSRCPVRVISFWHRAAHFLYNSTNIHWPQRILSRASCSDGRAASGQQVTGCGTICSGEAVVVVQLSSPRSAKTSPARCRSNSSFGW